MNNWNDMPPPPDMAECEFGVLHVVCADCGALAGHGCGLDTSEDRCEPFAIVVCAAADCASTFSVTETEQASGKFDLCPLHAGRAAKSG